MILRTWAQIYHAKTPACIGSTANPLHRAARLLSGRWEELDSNRTFAHDGLLPGAFSSMEVGQQSSGYTHLFSSKCALISRHMVPVAGNEIGIHQISPLDPTWHEQRGSSLHLLFVY